MYLVRVVPFNATSIGSYIQLHASLQDLKHSLKFVLWKFYIRYIRASWIEFNKFSWNSTTRVDGSRSG